MSIAEPKSREEIDVANRIYEKVGSLLWPILSAWDFEPLSISEEENCLGGISCLIGKTLFALSIELTGNDLYTVTFSSIRDGEVLRITENLFGGQLRSECLGGLNELQGKPYSEANIYCL